MPKLRRPSLPRGAYVAPDRVNRRLDEAQERLFAEDYPAVIAICKQLLTVLPATSPQRADALHYLSNAYGLLKRFEEAYQAALETVRINRKDAVYWYNLGQSARITMRTGESLTYFEHAAELETKPERRKQCLEEVKFARKLVRSELKLRGPQFTLDDLIEQQGLFRDGVAAMEAEQWAEAEDAFRRAIAMGDVLPQPWGNLGLALMMQRRFDEAEAALRRALEIDPQYELARQNLANLPSIRDAAALPAVAISDPMAGVTIHRDIVFEKD